MKNNNVKNSILVKCTLLSFFVLSSAAFATNGNEAFVGGTLPPGSYACQKTANDTTAIGSFYINTKGSSKKVVVASAKQSENGSGVEGCYEVHFTWRDSQIEEKAAYCCPFGAN